MFPLPQNGDYLIVRARGFSGPSRNPSAQLLAQSHRQPASRKPRFRSFVSPAASNKPPRNRIGGGDKYLFGTQAQDAGLLKTHTEGIVTPVLFPACGPDEAEFKPLLESGFGRTARVRGAFNHSRLHSYCSQRTLFHQRETELERDSRTQMCERIMQEAAQGGERRRLALQQRLRVIAASRLPKPAPPLFPCAEINSLAATLTLKSSSGCGRGAVSGRTIKGAKCKNIKEFFSKLKEKKVAKYSARKKPTEMIICKLLGGTGT